MKTRPWFGLSAAAATFALLITPAVTQAAKSGGVATGDPAPNFTLTDSNGTEHSLSDFAGKTVVLEWTNLQCPFVKKFYNEGHMQAMQQQYTEGGDVVWLLIASSAEGKQGYLTADGWNSAVESQGINSTAVLLDTSGEVGKLYAAKTTPHMYVIDGEGTLRYQGAIDSVRSTKTGDIEGATNYVAEALEAIAASSEVPTETTTAYGCSVKY
ncbi:MAG: thioredoxin family protein [Planctomycetota bacterium]